MLSNRRKPELLHNIQVNTVFLYSIGHNKTVPILQTSDSLESRHTKARLHPCYTKKILRPPAEDFLMWLNDLTVYISKHSSQKGLKTMN